MEAAIITLLATMIVIMFGGFWRVRSDIADTKADISRVEGSLRAEIVRVEGKLTAEIAGVEGKLEAEIAGVEGKLTAEIAQVEGKLDTDRSRIEGKLDAYIDTTDKFQTDIRADVSANTTDIAENARAIAVIDERTQTASATDTTREQLAEAAT